ncbi:MAG TPA: tetratricopeptide repeat protein [Kofleriaceae bacterium]|nr:tetratricopeptide repeat protein [Kofleriaceae bacterium]
MKLRSLVIMLCLGASLTAAAKPKVVKKPPPKSPAAKLDKKQLEVERHEWMAQYYLRRANDYAGAAKEYQAILKLDPKNLSASLALASIYTRDKKDKLAIDVLTKLTKQSPASQDAWLALAELQANAADDKGMRASLDKAIALDPTNTQSYWLQFDRASKRMKAGDPNGKDDALAAAKKIVAYSRRKVGPMYTMAERAIVELSGDPIQLTVYDAKRAYAAAFETGVIGKINQQMALARQGFEECTKAQPKNEDCHYNLGLVYSSVKSSDAYDPKKALAEFAAAPTLPAAYIEAAKLYRAQDKNTEARAALDKAIALDPQSAAAHVELGIVDKLAGKTDAAVEHFVAAIDADPYGAMGERGLVELTKVKPTHPRVTEGVLAGKGNDVFSSERYKSVVELIERELGGVEANPPELAALDEIVRRLSEGSAIKQTFKVQLVASGSVNAFALADGRVYVTRGLIDLLKKKFPNRAIDANNDILGHVLAHELSHVIRRHTLNTAVFQEAIKDSSRFLDPSVLTHVTRIHEIDADREGIVMAFLAGYHPRGGIEFMEVMGQDLEIPKNLDHPTFQERVEYLTEYWTNDVRYAFVSFKLGVAAMDKGAKLEATDMQAAIAAYDDAVDNFKRFRAMLPSLKEAMNDLGIAYTKLGVLAMAKTESPLGRWQTRFSLERDSAVKYVGLARDEDKSQSRGSGGARLPWQLREAIAQFKEALAADETYSKARLNLAAAYTAANQLDNAKEMLGKVEAKRGVTDGDIELIRGIVLAESKDYDKARASFEKAIQSQQNKRAASYNLALTLQLAGKKDEAKRAYTQYAKLYPGGPWAKAAEAAAAKL